MATVPLNLCLDLSFYKSTFLLTVLSAFPESPHLTALRLKLPVYELNHPNVRECFLSSLPERKKKKREDNVW